MASILLSGNQFNYDEPKSKSGEISQTSPALKTSSAYKQQEADKASTSSSQDMWSGDLIGSMINVLYGLGDMAEAASTKVDPYTGEYENPNAASVYYGAQSVFDPYTSIMDTLTSENASDTEKWYSLINWLTGGMAAPWYGEEQTKRKEKENMGYNGKYYY